MDHEYAERYTRKERVRFVLVGLTLGGAIMWYGKHGRYRTGSSS
jgi:hypothetical protein